MLESVKHLSKWELFQLHELISELLIPKEAPGKFVIVLKINGWVVSNWQFTHKYDWAVGYAAEPGAALRFPDKEDATAAAFAIATLSGMHGKLIVREVEA